MKVERLYPKASCIYVVRWVRADGRGDVKHRYYVRESDAWRLLSFLRAKGYTAETFRSSTAWRVV